MANSTLNHDGRRIEDWTRSCNSVRVDARKRVGIVFGRLACSRSPRRRDAETGGKLDTDNIFEYGFDSRRLFAAIDTGSSPTGLI
jgi:hypothetical protein